jgi:hypothetical protein
LRRPARADIAAGAADILDVEILAGLLRELLRDQAREQVGRAAGGESDNDLYRRAGQVSAAADVRPAANNDNAKARCFFTSASAVWLRLEMTRRRRLAAPWLALLDHQCRRIGKKPAS